VCIKVQLNKHISEHENVYLTLGSCTHQKPIKEILITLTPDLGEAGLGFMESFESMKVERDLKNRKFAYLE
jgi:hypothetical protein